jgi:hypothetical protein
VLETAPPPVTAPAQPKQQGPIKMTVETESGQVVSETEIPVPPPPDKKQAPAKK